MSQDPSARYRLPRDVVPSRYDLVIDTDLDTGAFRGSVDVAVAVEAPVSEIVLNAVELELSGGAVTAGDRRTIAVTDVRLDAETERAHLTLAEPVPAGDASLHLDFGGAINDKLVGFYRSTHKDADGASKVIATTHFEATDARRAFPCWDEPDLKAVYGVTLIVRDGLTALSNGPEIEREDLGDGRVRIRFADTMPMSTYLVAFVVGDLVLVDRPGAVPPQRVAVVAGKEDLAAFALDVSQHSLTWFADYYGIAYPDAKVDHVALPDFAQGAMENLGCITYREIAVLVDPATSTHGEQMDVAETVAHELAHMWFGDLVTMGWWNGLWLNEAFATFMSMLAVDDWRPDWEVWNQFARFRTAALEIDALETTRPIEYPVHSPDDANGMFDTLTYLKGGSILRMLEQYLGPDRFRDGIRRYLAKHAHGNTETHDLWDALEEETGEPVRRIMDAWIFQGGYPAITVEVDGDTLRFGQRRYLPSRPDDATWPVPLLVRQTAPDGSSRTEALLVEAEGATLPLKDAEAVVVANAGGHSFVRVFYDEALAARITGALGQLSPLERYALVDDAWAAVVDGTMAASAFCRFVEGFRDETDLPTWQLILTGLGWCDRFLDGDARDRFRDFVRDLVMPGIGRLGWEPRPDESDLTRSLRGALIQALATLADDPEAKAQARELELGAEAGEAIDAHLAAAAVQIVASDGDAADYDRFRGKIADPATPQEEIRYLQALAAFREPELMARTLDATLTDDVRSQDAPFLLARSTLNRDLGWQAWSFIAEHWDELNERFATSNIITLTAAIKYLSERAQADDVAGFFATHDIPQAALQLQQNLERQRIAATLRERATPDLRAAFGA